MGSSICLYKFVEQTISEEILVLVRQILSGRSIPELPDQGMENAETVSVCSDLIAIRRILQNFAAGNLEDDIHIRGAIAGCLKTLQANLRHLTWQVQQVAAGDFSQRVDFMGAFSEAFNSMVVQLHDSLSDLKESETRLLQSTLDLQDEIRQRIHAKKILQQSEERWNLAVQCSRDGIWDMNLETKQAWYSDRYMEMFGLTEADLPKDLRWDRFIHPDDVEEIEFFEKLFTRRIPPQEFCRDVRIRCSDGNYLWVRAKGMPVLQNADTPSRIIGVMSDISFQKEKEYAMAYRAMHDNLTGLPNRYLLQDRLLQHVAVAKRNDSSFVLVTMDLDNFKGVNDTWGHGAGDVLLKKLADLLRACLRDTDTAARLGGDEFVFVYTCLKGQEETATKTVLERLYEMLATQVDLGPTTYTICTSAGVAFFPRHATDITELFEKADAALYQAKGRGKNTYSIWEPTDG